MKKGNLIISIVVSLVLILVFAGCVRTVEKEFGEVYECSGAGCTPPEPRPPDEPPQSEPPINLELPDEEQPPVVQPSEIIQSPEPSETAPFGGSSPIPSENRLVTPQRI